MYKEELIQKLIEKEPKDFPSKAAANRTVTNLFEVIIEGLKEDGFVTINGFGRFRKSDVAEREIKNPQNPDETLKVGNYSTVRFTPSKRVRDRF